MKKAILPAIISALLATSAQAATLYEVDNTSVSMSGEVDALYKIDDGDDKNAELGTWANVQFDLSTKVSDSVTAIGSFEVETSDFNETDVVVDDAWIGAATEFGTVKAGETGSSFALMEKTELSNELDEYDAIYSDSEGTGNAVRYENSVGPVALSANYSFVAGHNDYALSADYAVDENFNIGAAYLSDGDDDNSWGISGSVTVDALYAAATFTDNDVEGVDFTTKALSAAYTFDLAKVYGSYQMQEFDDTGADIDHWYLGVSRDLTSNITAFVEYSDTEVDGGEDTSMFVTGVYYAF
ncbi:MAG: porin [Psychromonas sp.]